MQNLKLIKFNINTYLVFLLASCVRVAVAFCIFLVLSHLFATVTKLEYRDFTIKSIDYYAIQGVITKTE